MAVMFNTVVFLVFQICLSISAVDPPPIKWVNGYTNNGCEAHPHAGVQTTDGGFYMVGDSVCYDNNEAAKRYIFAVKTDANGKEEWHRALGTTEYNYGKFGVELSDGNYAIAGTMSVAVSGHFKYIEHRALFVLSGKDGSLLSQTLFPNNGASDGLRDGLMCINAVGSDPTKATEYLVSGYIGAEAGDDEEPMFLIYGGRAVLMKMSYESSKNEFNLVFETVFNNTGRTIAYMQGMRTWDDYTNQQYVVSSTAVQNDDANYQFGLLTTDYNGKMIWDNMYAAANAYGSGFQSHPYALSLSSENDGYVIAGLAPLNGGYCEGRLIKAGFKEGKLEWDVRWNETNYGPKIGVECYGVSITKDNGYIVTCGVGDDGPVSNAIFGNDNDDGPDSSETWMAMLHRTDVNGNQLWQKCYTNQTQNLNNAGEYVLTTSDWGYAMYIDSNTWGPPGTGGNFGLMVLYPDD